MKIGTLNIGQYTQHNNIILWYYLLSRGYLDLSIYQKFVGILFRISGHDLCHFLLNLLLALYLLCASTALQAPLWGNFPFSEFGSQNYSRPVARRVLFGKKWTLSQLNYDAWHFTGRLTSKRSTTQTQPLTRLQIPSSCAGKRFLFYYPLVDIFHFIEKVDPCRFRGGVGHPEGTWTRDHFNLGPRVILRVHVDIELILSFSC